MYHYDAYCDKPGKLHLPELGYGKPYGLRRPSNGIIPH